MAGDTHDGGNKAMKGEREGMWGRGRIEERRGKEVKTK